MGLKAGWVALFIFVWVIGAFLGSTFDMQTTEAASGLSYSTGTATFTTDDETVSSGGGAAWTAAMENGNIQADTDAIWHKIRHVGGGFLANATGVATGTPQTLAIGANVVTVTQLGTLVIDFPLGNTGIATSGVATVTGSPVALGVGTNTITITGVVGAIDVTAIGLDVIYLYTPYSGAGGAGLAYTMRPAPGWAGTGGGGYSTSPIGLLQSLMYANQAEQKNALIGAFTMIINPKFWGAMFDILTWQWSFMAGYTMFYWIFLFPFVAMGLLCILLLVYGIITGNLSW